MWICPDQIKGVEYFTTIPAVDGATYWHHRELVRYKHGRSKKLKDALGFVESKYAELYKMLEPIRKDLT